MACYVQECAVGTWHEASLGCVHGQPASSCYRGCTCKLPCAGAGFAHILQRCTALHDSAPAAELTTSSGNSCWHHAGSTTSVCVCQQMDCAILCTAGIADAQVRLQQARGAIQGAQRQVQEGMLQRQEAAAQQRLQRVRRLRAYSPLLAQPHLKVGTPSCMVMGCSRELQWVACCRGGRQLCSHGLSVCCLPADVVLPPPPQAAFDAHLQGQVVPTLLPP